MLSIISNTLIMLDHMLSRKLKGNLNVTKSQKKKKKKERKKKHKEILDLINKQNSVFVVCVWE